MSLYLVFLFVVLSPGILLRIPPKGSKLVVAVVHGLVFALVYCLTYKFVLNATYVEYFQDVKNPAPTVQQNKTSIISNISNIFSGGKPAGPPAHCRKYIPDLNNLYTMKSEATKKYDNLMAVMKRDGCDPNASGP
jgi:hypothetical protein